MTLGYSKFDPELTKPDFVSGSPASNAWSVDQQSGSSFAQGYGGSSAWSIDQASGKVNVNFFGDINLQGNSLINVQKILGMDGKWSIDESGNIVAETVTAKKLCLEEICIEKTQLKTLLQAVESSGEATTMATSTTP